MKLIVEAARAQPRYVRPGQIGESALSRVKVMVSTQFSGIRAARSRRLGPGQVDVATRRLVAVGRRPRKVELSQEWVELGLGEQIGWRAISPGNLGSTPGKMTLKISRGKVSG